MGATTWDRPADPSIIASLSTMLVASAAIQRHAFTVVLVWSQEFDRITDVIAMERRVKGWSRIKKEALIRGDYNALRSEERRVGKEGVGTCRSRCATVYLKKKQN